MDRYYALGFLAGFTMVGLFCVLLYKRKIRKSERKKYDERQQIIRGRGYKYAFFSLMFYFAIMSAVTELVGKTFITISAISIIGICFGVGVYAVYCIMNGGYFAINEKQRSVMILLGIIALINVISSVGLIHDKELVKDGVLTGRCANLACTVLFVVVFIAIVIKGIIDKKEDEQQ